MALVLHGGPAAVGGAAPQPASAEQAVPCGALVPADAALPAPPPPEQEQEQQQEQQEYQQQEHGLDWAYAVLGLENGSSVDTVRSAFREQVLALHPDKTSAEGSKQRFLDVRRAYEMLLAVAPLPGAAADGGGTLVLYIADDAQGGRTEAVELSSSATLNMLINILSRRYGVAASRVQLLFAEQRIDQHALSTPLAELGISMEATVHLRVGPKVYRDDEFDEDDIDNTVAYLEIAVALGDWEARDRLSRAVITQRRRDLRATTASCTTSEAAARIGASCCRNGYHQNAEAFYRRAAELAISTQELAAHLVSVATSLRYQGMDDGAVFAAGQALSARPGFGDALLIRGWAQETLECFQEAAADFAEAQSYFCGAGGGTIDREKAQQAAAGKDRAQRAAEMQRALGLDAMPISIR
eukprot:TRINITY_DN13702_c3_g1_i2.p2 TRINITY_DN13702_c3_g1~~TRINITY_DN13702_c3_g1_i2.p2  ORF type:complete len:435 (+),score=183.41 TRINITY_DN13702_c3_g1_i2:68-1306(+)